MIWPPSPLARPLSLYHILPARFVPCLPNAESFHLCYGCVIMGLISSEIQPDPRPVASTLSPAAVGDNGVTFMPDGTENAEETAP